ncbi:MAG TPA: carbohydrate kinase family protein [Candidatus Onthousia faecipullorum]|uniref:Carbohydrate kinase family protein n=1 Tax=Candidatus Onthousia faecipullorum TaxID=2840887 RepID=A0A9D1GC10_9FIRM|nr:carbohydrate kinase family protein [Candidatus Onthousia faecipullorum]
MKYLTIGHASYDITFRVDKYPIENTKQRVGKHIDCGGGPASNAGYLLALWGCDVSFQGVAGNDYYGEMIKAEFNSVNVDTTYLELIDNFETDLSIIIANSTNASRTIITSKDNIVPKCSMPNDNKYDVILVDGEEEEMSKRVLLNNKSAIKVIDAGTCKPSTVSLCPYVDYLVCSKNFALDYTKLEYDGSIDSLIKIYNKLVSDFHNTVVITLEDKGCFTKIDDEYKLIPSIKVKAVDTTGAGDIFHGAFTYFISHNYSLLDTCRLSNLTGALSTLKVGGRYSVPKLDAVLERRNLIDII